MYSNKNKSFTLVEMAISAGLVVVIGLVVFSVLASGLRIWQRANTPYIGEDINIFFEKIAVDLRNSFAYEDIEFTGSPDDVRFATLVKTNSQYPGLDRGIGEVIYFFDKDKEIITKNKRNLSQLFLEEEADPQVVLTNVTECVFSYYYYDPIKEEYFWLEEWSFEDFPLAVSIKLKVECGKMIYEFSRALRIVVE
jgi:hypothetical protein